MSSSPLLTEHVSVFSGALHICPQADAPTSEIQFEFSCSGNNENIIECGVQILAEEREISSASEDPNREVRFFNCLSLDEEARRAIIQRWAYKSVLLPYKEIPAEFTHKAKGNSITISSGTFSASSRFKACLLLSPNIRLNTKIVCRLRSKGVLIHELDSDLRRSWQGYPQLVTEHLLVFSGGLSDEEHRCLKADATLSNIVFEFSYRNNDDKIIECGVQILAEEGEDSSSKWKKHTDGAIQVFEMKVLSKAVNIQTGGIGLGSLL